MTRYREGKSALKKQGKRSAFQRKLKIVIRRERGPKIVEKKQNGQKGKKKQEIYTRKLQKAMGLQNKKGETLPNLGEKKGKLAQKRGET